MIWRLTEGNEMTMIYKGSCHCGKLAGVEIDKLPVKHFDGSSL